MGLPPAVRVDSATCRRADSGDARAVADLLIRSRQAAVGTIPAAVHPDAETHEWISTVVLPEREVWLTEDADRRALAVMVLDGSWVDQLYVDPVAQGEGIGRRLLEHAQALDTTGELQLWTFQANDRARRFYARNGFVEVELTDGAGNEERQPDVRLVWRRSASVTRRRSPSGCPPRPAGTSDRDR